MNNFRVTKKIQKSMAEQQKKNKTRKQSQKEEEEDATRRTTGRLSLERGRAFDEKREREEGEGESGGFEEK